MKNRLQEIRWEKDWSLTQLSKKSGVPKPTITLIENNNTDTPTQYINNRTRKIM